MEKDKEEEILFKLDSERSQIPYATRSQILYAIKKDIATNQGINISNLISKVERLELNYELCRYKFWSSYCFIVDCDNKFIFIFCISKE